MFCICLFGTTLYSSASPVNRVYLSTTEKAFLMGGAVALTTFLAIRSSFGRRTGAQCFGNSQQARAKYPRLQTSMKRAPAARPIDDPPH